MVNEAAISAAIADLKTQVTPNHEATAKKYNINKDTLRCCFKSKSILKNTAQLEAQKLLSNAYEKAFVEYINTLSAQRIPPTSAIIKNLIVKLTKVLVGEHWVFYFVKKHKN